jgi:hypothetical protein
MVLVSRRSQQLLQLVRSFAIPDYLPCTLILIIPLRFLRWSLSFFLRFCLSSLELLPESFGAWFAPSDQQTRPWYAILIFPRFASLSERGVICHIKTADLQAPSPCSVRVQRSDRAEVTA